MSTQVNHNLPPPQVYTIGGIRVEFPTKAYPSQIAMMNKVIQGLKQKQNCLLESPTGSGKSLALLCASLAWQRHEAARVAEYNAAIEERHFLQQTSDITKVQKMEVPNPDLEKTNSKGNATETEKERDVWLKGPTASFTVDLTDDEDDFQPPKRTKHSSTPTKDFNGFPKESDSASFAKPNPIPMDVSYDEDPYCELADKKLTVPKIFFGTRTHKQISQITRELRKTVYRFSRSVILASRDHSCVNPLVEKMGNKNEACKELLDQANVDGVGCGWHSAAKKFGNFANLNSYGVQPGYDLEDLVAAGRAAKACPYYATRHLMQAADIIFCPYNYLVEPNIRKSMSIELTGQIVIFDEAHNMEDSSREAASFSIILDDIRVAMQDCEKVGGAGTDSYAHQELANFLSILCQWMDSESRNLTELDFSSEAKHWNGTEFMAFMANAGVVEKLEKYKDHFRVISEKRDAQQEMYRERGKSRLLSEDPMITNTSMYVFEDLFRIFDRFIREAGKYRNDFRVALLKSSVRRRNNAYGQSISKLVTSLNFWCLNPAVTFSDLRSEVHCIILTSGTLSPIQSFQSELGTPFPIKLEASHVIDKNQIWACTISSGPTNKNLNGSFQSVETYAYQDELGELVLRVCKVIPHGVLCFFPSYRLLEKVADRWRITGCWKTIRGVKDIYIEPRTGNVDFQETITSFYASIDKSNDGPYGTVTGALFLAVCRGKVSEGLDFADNNARAVICIGIPFPNYKDLQVGLKKEYNERNRSRGLLSGGEWYEIQAFRALNQALGRCIRHRYDWGAILLVDDRFQKTPRYVNSLSRWVRASVQKQSSWLETEASLIAFRDHMLEILPQPVKEKPFIDLDSEGSSKSWSNPSDSDGFSGSGGFTPDSPAFSNNVNNSQSPYFGNTKTPGRLFPIFGQRPNTCDNKVKKRSPIVFDDDEI